MSRITPGMVDFSSTNRRYLFNFIIGMKTLWQYWNLMHYKSGWYFHIVYAVILSHIDPVCQENVQRFSITRECNRNNKRYGPHHVRWKGWKANLWNIVKTMFLIVITTCTALLVIEVPGNIWQYSRKLRYWACTITEIAAW